MQRLPLNSTIGGRVGGGVLCRSGGNAFQKRRIEEAEQSCRRCGGQGQIPCARCRGTGRIPREGYHKHNQLNLANILTSNWTAMESTFGWRHFTVIEKKKANSQTFVLMSATCEKDTQFWVNARNLRDRAQWSSGWLRKSELELSLTEGTACHLCMQTGQIPCPDCTS